MTAGVLIVGVGGLGRAMALESLGRGLQVHVLVRDRVKYEAALDPAARASIGSVTVGDATDPAVLRQALSGVDVVLSGLGAAPGVAAAVAGAVEQSSATKLCWPAGSTNVKAEDGRTPAYRTMSDLGPWVSEAYERHQACIEAIRGRDLISVFLCPGRMEPAEHRSPDVASTIRIDRVAGPVLSFPDAAWVMLEAALTDTWDGELVSAATPSLS